MNPDSSLQHFPDARPLGIIVIFLALAWRLTAATYYVDYASGDDTGAGLSTTAAWKHCPGDPAASGVPSGTMLAPGDTVTFKGGAAYIFTSTSGIAVLANGTQGNPITYDGNSAGNWGVGRPQFTDNFGNGSITAFTASSAAAWLTFQNLEFSGIGGAASLPADPGSAAAARFGGGIMLSAGGTNIVVDGCLFRDLGYAFNQKPMSAASLAGTAIAIRGATSVSITNCDFSRATAGIDFSGAANLAGVSIANCVFHDAVVWPLNWPVSLAAGVTVTGCSETNNAQFDRAAWTGYGDNPRCANRSAIAGTSVTLNASAVASPFATFQWVKEGSPITGASTATLTFPAVATSDAGIYAVVATNSLGSTTSHELALTVTATTTTSGSTTGTSNSTPPVITTQPVSQTAAPLATVSFSVAASGSPTPTYQWFRNGVTFSGWTGATLTLTGLSTNDAGTYVAVATNSAGTATSNGATLTVSTTTTTTTTTAPTTTPPSITTQPASQTVSAGANVTFSVAASGSPTPTYQWLKNGTAITGATNATLSLPQVTLADAATYAAVASNSAGSAQSNGATLTVTSTSVAPVFTVQPTSVTTTQKSTVTFTASASGTPGPTYQWFKDGAAIGGATASTLTLRNVNKGSVGTYTVTATNIAGSAVSNGASLVVASTRAASIDGDPSASGEIAGYSAPAGAGSRLVNLSVRATATSGAPIIVGFVVSGSTSKSLLIRGSGPALHQFGVPDVLADPTLALYSGANLLAANDDWSTSSDAAAIAPISARVGAFALPEASEDAALLANVTSGAYTGQISGKQAANGAALIELYDIAPTTDARLVNLSVRTTVRANGESPTIGFVIAGDEPKTLLIRAVGPALAAFGVSDALSDPRIGIYDGNTRLQENDNWSGTVELADAFKRAGAFPLSDNASRDAALIFTALPGAYTAVVSGANSASGNVLVEVYELP